MTRSHESQHQAWGREPESESSNLHLQTQSREQTGNGWEAMTSQSLPPPMYLLHFTITFPNDTTHWGTCMTIHQPMGDASHSSHHKNSENMAISSTHTFKTYEVKWPGPKEKWTNYLTRSSVISSSPLGYQWQIQGWYRSFTPEHSQCTQMTMYVEEHHQTSDTVFSHSHKPLKEMCTYAIKDESINPEGLNHAYRFKQDAG